MWKRLVFSSEAALTSHPLISNQQIMKLPVSKLFNQPVDLVSYPDYLFVNPYPVDLALIVARLTTGFYRQPEAVRSDLQHLVDNAVRYNRPDSAVVQHARLVFQLAVRALELTRFRPVSSWKLFCWTCNPPITGSVVYALNVRSHLTLFFDHNSMHVVINQNCLYRQNILTDYLC